MAKPELDAKLARTVAIVAFSLIIAGAATACRRAADPDQATRDKLLTESLVKWQAKPPDDRQREQAAGDPRTHLSPLVMETAQNANAKEMKALLALGADRKTLNDALLLVSRSEPLLVSADGAVVKDFSLRYAATASLLLEKGAGLEVRDEQGYTPLVLAASYGETAVVKLFLQKKANIEARNQHGETALIAAACNCPSIDMPDTDNSIRLLLESGVDIEAKDKLGRTALITAAAWGRSSIINILLDKGAQIEAQDSKGNTALLISARGQGYPTADAVQTLLARGADVEARNNQGESALMLAASSGGSEDVKVVRTLLSRGADVRANDLKGRTALDLASSKARTDIVALLKAAAEKSR